jgi:hypothetical protein
MPSDLQGDVDRASRRPWVVGGGGGVVTAIAQMLLASRITADPNGRLVTVALSALMFGFLAYAIYQSCAGWKKWPGLMLALAGVASFTAYVWPYTLVASPRSVIFTVTEKHPSEFANETYLLRLTNRSDKDIYVAEMDITIRSNNRPEEFSLNLSPGSRKPLSGQVFGDDQPLSDTSGILCSDLDGNPVYIVIVAHLSPSESREFSVTHTARAIARLSTEAGFYTFDPQPTTHKGGVFGSRLQFTRQIDQRTGCKSFAFLLDPPRGRNGLVWF